MLLPSTDCGDRKGRSSSDSFLGAIASIIELRNTTPVSGTKVIFKANTPFRVVLPPGPPCLLVHNQGYLCGFPLPPMTGL